MTARKAPTQIRKKTPLPRDDAERELRRWSPEEVVEFQLLPYQSVRLLKERCYRREIWHHLDGKRITFTAEDIRREAERNAVAPIALSA